jgi:two-component system LytT family response regulator
MTESGTGDRLRLILVDDEEPARDLLREFLEGRPDIDIVAECANGFEAVKAVADTDPDLMLLDILMPKLNGFEVMELLERDVPVIFITAFDEHALKAFDVHAVDYLLKPFTRERLDEALVRARNRIGSRGPAIHELAEAADPENRTLARILIREGSDVHVIPVDDVDYIEADDDRVIIHSGGKSHRKLQRLAILEERLDRERFVRIHRSYILNVDRLNKIELYAKDSRIAILSGGAKLPVSRSGYARLRELL